MPTNIWVLETAGVSREILSNTEIRIGRQTDFEVLSGIRFRSTVVVEERTVVIGSF
jgi:hypothetical protein